MAPRPRGRSKKGTLRMDAALDAMAPYGFDPKLVRKTVNELLSVYTQEGWIFIEDCSYKLLIDTLLEKGGEEEEEGEGDDKGDSLQGNSSSHVNSTPTIEPETNKHVDTAPGTNGARESTSPGNKVHNPGSPSKEVRDHASPSYKSDTPETRIVHNEFLQSIPTIYQASLKHLFPVVVNPPVNLEQNIHKKQTDTSTENPNAASGGATEHPSTAPPYKIISRPSYDGFPPREVKPCHGWIDEDEDEDSEFIELTPAPLPERLRRMLNTVDGMGELAKKKRRSRWDVKPDDM